MARCFVLNVKLTGLSGVLAALNHSDLCHRPENERAEKGKMREGWNLQ